MLLKVKNFFDEEALVIGHEKGSGRLQNTMGHLVVKTPDGRQFSVGSGFSDKERHKPPKVGAVITYRYQELTSKSNKPRFPVYVGTRFDLDWAEYCKSYKPPTLNEPGDLKLNNSLLYSKNHGLGQYASDHLGDAGPSSSSSTAPGNEAASSSSSSSSAEAPKRKRAELEDDGDDDGDKKGAGHDNDDDDDKPACKYGANCYQKSTEHFQKFSHPGKSPVKKPKQPAAPAPVPTPAPAPVPVAAPTPTPAPATAATATGDTAGGVDSARRRTLHYSSTNAQASAEHAPQHKNHHISEEKEEEEEDDEKLVCIYGDKCYRKNKLHYVEFYHPATHPMLSKGQIPEALIEGQPPKKAPKPQAQEKGKEKAEEGDGGPALTDNIIMPDKLNTSLAALTSSSEDESITWDAKDGHHTATESEAEKDNDVTFVLPPKKVSALEENDQTFILPPKKKSENQSLGASQTQKMGSDILAAVYLIPTAIGK